VTTQLATITAQETRKIVGHISTMRPETTMTINNMHYDFVPDVSTKNEILSLAISPALKLAAGVWTEEAGNSLATARLRCLHYSLGRLKASWPDWEFCLLAGHKTLQPDNRITRHRGLWKSLVAGGADLPQGEFIKESVVVIKGGMRAFSAVRFELSQFKAIHSIMLMTQAAITFTTKPAVLTKVAELTERGWPSTNTKPPEEILELVCDQSGLVIDAYGDFDDHDAAVAAIGRKEVLGALEP
jgi:hypothetical protein